MSLVKGKGRQTTAISRLSEGQKVYLRALRDGAPIMSDWREAAIMGGYGYMANEGAFTTGQTGGGEGTTLDQNQPEMLVSVPNGYCIIPIRVDVAMHPAAYAAEADEYEILIAADQDKEHAKDGTCDDITIYNMNTLCGLTSVCTCEGGCSADITNPTLDLELARLVTKADADATTEANFVWHPFNLVYEPRYPIILNGPAMLVLYWGGTAAAQTAFATVQWLEFPESVFEI